MSKLRGVRSLRPWAVLCRFMHFRAIIVSACWRVSYRYDDKKLLGRIEIRLHSNTKRLSTPR